MKLHSPRHVMAQLTEAAALQDEVAHHWLVFEWGQLVFAQLARLWQHLETHEAMAYEDKVTAQIRMLGEAVSILWRLHRTLAQMRRRLVQHQQHL